MKLLLKDETINLNGLSLEMLCALLYVFAEWGKQGMETVVITSANDGEHIEGSLHKTGNALDIRTRTLPDVIQAGDSIRAALCQDYDVLIYETHIHIEYDPKET